MLSIGKLCVGAVWGGITGMVETHRQLKSYFDSPGSAQTESLNQLALGLDMKRHACLFYQTCVLATVNHDPDIGDLLKVVFVPDYNVTIAKVLIPGSDLFQHINGISNMKFAMNGCIQIGTLDGANVEIRQKVREDNFFLSGAEAHLIAGLRKERSKGKEHNQLQIGKYELRTIPLRP
ncbi:alpha-1,4 glucan phosphorylase L-2 isozyme, chloroplastic/amyloplastic-like protein isoform X1 [Tanacetum coccineum]